MSEGVWGGGGIIGVGVGFFEILLLLLSAHRDDTKGTLGGPVDSLFYSRYQSKNFHITSMSSVTIPSAVPTFVICNTSLDLEVAHIGRRVKSRAFGASSLGGKHLSFFLLGSRNIT